MLIGLLHELRWIAHTPTPGVLVDAVDAPNLEDLRPGVSLESTTKSAECRYRF